MGYINTHKLIHCMAVGEKPNSKELLSEVNRSKIEQALNKSKDGLPHPFVCTNKPIEEKNLAKMPYKDKQLLWDLFDRLKASSNESEEILAKLIRLRRKYPNVPAIYNYMSIDFQKNKFQKKQNHLLKTVI